jgi:hypothetical protein
MTYTLLINSDDANSGTIDNSRFFFDWDTFVDEKYKVYVQFVSSALTSSFVKIPSLFIELGQSNSFSVNKTLIISQNTHFVGQLYKVETKTSPYLISDTNSKCIELLHRPTNKDFNVRILNDDETPFTSETTYSFTIKLTFEEY